MGKETPNYMSDEFDNKLPQEFSLSEIELFSRRYCEPTEPIYKNNPELAKDPFKAIEAINWHGPSLEKVTDPVDGLLVAKAKFDVAEKELRLNPKQKEHFSGVKENIEGAIGFLDTLRAKAESKAVRAIASGATIIGMTLGAAGCGNVIARPIEETPNISPIVETANIPTQTPTQEYKPTETKVPTITETPIATPTGIPETIDENFSYSSSINPDRLETLQARFIPRLSEYSNDMTDILNYPLIGILGYPVAYNLEGNENGTQLFVLFVTGGGLIKANIKILNFEQEPWPQTMHEIDRIDDKEAKEISNSFDNLIKQINEGEELNSISYIISITINTKSDARACLASLEGLENAERLCAYDASNVTLAPQQMLDKIESFVIPTKGKTPEEALNLENYPVLSSEGNMDIRFQLQAP